MAPSPVSKAVSDLLFPWSLGKGSVRDGRHGRGGGPWLHTRHRLPPTVVDTDMAPAPVARTRTRVPYDRLLPRSTALIRPMDEMSLAW